MQSDNFTQALKDAGLRSPSELEKMWDVNFAVGGPIKRDKLWFFGTTRSTGSYVTISNTFFNKNAGDPDPALVLRTGSEPAGTTTEWWTSRCG